MEAGAFGDEAGMGGEAGAAAGAGGAGGMLIKLLVTLLSLAVSMGPKLAESCGGKKDGGSSRQSSSQPRTPVQPERTGGIAITPQQVQPAGNQALAPQVVEDRSASTANPARGQREGAVVLDARTLTTGAGQRTESRKMRWMASYPSPPRRRGSRRDAMIRRPWIPASAGMTDFSEALTAGGRASESLTPSSTGVPHAMQVVSISGDRSIAVATREVR